MGICRYERKEIKPMLTTILLLWIGAHLNAPGVYFILCWLKLIADLIYYGLKMYKMGSNP